MDPLEGVIQTPKTLHKYIYTDGDPADKLDPTGKDAIIEYAAELRERSEATIAELRVTSLVVREDLLNACLAVEMPAFEAGAVPFPAAYDLALALCTAILD